jgi:mono/diheme cytochrome c family protein
MPIVRSAAVVFLFAGSMFLARPQSDKPLTDAEVKQLKNPVPYSKKSIAAGHSMYQRYSCTGCHGADGKAQVDVVADATDLTQPKGYRDGTSDGEIFRSIHDGAGTSMPNFRSQIDKTEDIWGLVNFIHSLWPENMRPPLEEASTSDGRAKR